MAIASGEIHEPALAQDIYRATVFEGKGLDVLPGRMLLHSMLPEPGDIHLHVKVTGVAADGPVLHLQEFRRGDHVLAARGGDEQVADGGGIGHGHHPEAVHHGLEGLDRIHFRDDDPGAEPLGPHGDSLAAKAVTRHDDILSRDDEVRRAVDAVPDALARAVAVVEEMLAVGIVHEHHREGQFPRAVHRLQAEDAGRRLLAAADHAGQQIRELPVNQRHQVSPIVDDDVRAHLQHAPEVILVFLHGRAVDGEDVEPLVDQRRGHVVLRTEGIAAGGVHFRPAGGQAQAQACRLGLHVHAQGDLESLERLRGHEIFLDAVKQRHVVADPLDLERSAFPQVDVSDVTGHGLYH